MESDACDPWPTRFTECFAVTRIPGAVLTQVKLRPGSTSDTFQRAGGSFGCRTRTRVPTASGPGSSFSALVTESVHSCQRSTSLMTDQTLSGGAAISTLIE